MSSFQKKALHDTRMTIKDVQQSSKLGATEDFMLERYFERKPHGISAADGYSFRRF